MPTKAEVLKLFIDLGGNPQRGDSLSNLTGVKFTYAVSKNINIIKPEIEAIDKSIELPEKYKEYDNERIELVKKYAEKKEDGSPKMKMTLEVKDKDGNVTKPAQETNEFDISEAGMKKFEKDFEVLKEKRKEVIDARDKQIEDYSKLLLSESEVELHKIKLEDIPKDITKKQMDSIYELVEE